VGRSSLNCNRSQLWGLRTRHRAATLTLRERQDRSQCRRLKWLKTIQEAVRVAIRVASQKTNRKTIPQKRDSMRRKRGPCSAFADVFAAAFTAQQTQILALNSDCPAELVGALTLL
jgi:hypothetical protein